MEDLITIIYITPIGIAFLGRVIWYIWFSNKEDEFFPPTTVNNDTDVLFVLVAFWPVTILCLAAYLIVFLAIYPFYFIVSKLRNNRLNKNESKY